jgi:hypothetical protein
MSREPRPQCTGLTAAWCPNHGRCTCLDREKAMDDPECSLHAPDSLHAEEVTGVSRDRVRLDV